jgi:hypothetical protein
MSALRLETPGLGTIGEGTIDGWIASITVGPRGCAQARSTTFALANKVDARPFYCKAAVAATSDALLPKPMSAS